MPLLNLDPADNIRLVVLLAQVHKVSSIASYLGVDFELFKARHCVVNTLHKTTSTTEMRGRESSQFLRSWSLCARRLLLQG
jgi:hypothetical protein